MQNILGRYVPLAKRWTWLVVLGVVICGGATYVFSKLIPPVYQASAVLIINIKTSSSSFDNISASQLATATYAQVITSSAVFDPVLAEHPGLTRQQLGAMVTAKAEPNTSIIEINVENGNPDLAAQLANDISQSFVSYASAQLPLLQAAVQIVGAEVPIDPIRPKPILYTGIATLVGLGLALSLIIIFEWIEDRLARPEEVQELLGMETLAVIPRLSRRQRIKSVMEIPVVTEGYRRLCTGLIAAQRAKPFKSVLVTSALPGEGKSTIAANLASFLAMANKRVLLVDADLRHPQLDQHFQLDNSQGLSNILEEIWAQLEAEPEGQETDIPTLRVLTAGVPPSNPIELLQTPAANRLFDYFKKAPFDYIIFDTSPLLPVADAQFLASHVQATVLVIDASKTPRSALRSAKQLLSRTQTMAAGVVINKSGWSDYSASRRYLRSRGQTRAQIAMVVPPNTPPVDSEVVPDITMALPRRQQFRDE
jgi:polysaccharide biosynthesis transport protein